MNAHIKLYNIRGLAICFALIIAVMLSCYFMFHNPYKDLHTQIMATSDMIRSYYRDQPGYWKLSTDFAKENGMVKIDLNQYKDYEVAIGSGDNGDVVMPGEMSFNIILKKLNKSACIGLSEMPVSRDKQLGLETITLNDTVFAWGEDHALPIGKYKTRDICKSSDNMIIWTFH